MKLSAFVLYCSVFKEGETDKSFPPGFSVLLRHFENDTTNPAQKVFNYVVSDEFSIRLGGTSKGQPKNGRRKDEIMRD